MDKNQNRPINIIRMGDKSIDIDYILDLTDEKDTTLFGSSSDAKQIYLPKEQEQQIISDIYKKIDNVFGHVDTLKDDRLLVLTSALLIENAVEALLSAISPGFDKLLSRSTFTFSMKLEVAKAMKLIPFKVLNNADFIRDIRNKFAHKLEIESFESLGEKYIQSLRDRHIAYFIDKSSEEILFGMTVSDSFKEFVYCTVSAIYYFTVLVDLHSSFIRQEDEYIQQFQSFVNRKYL